MQAVAFGTKEGTVVVETFADDSARVVGATQTLCKMSISDSKCNILGAYSEYMKGKETKVRRCTLLLFQGIRSACAKLSTLQDI